MISNTASIHATSIVEDGAQIGDGVKIGPFCTIGPKVKLGTNVVLTSHVVVMGNTSVGEGTLVAPQAVLGGDPQNIHYRGEDTELIIGKNCNIREGVTMNTGMPDAGNKTVVGDNGLFLAYAHVAHDCRIGNNVILSNNVMLGGHVEIGNNAILSGGVGVHQFVRIGHHAFIGGLAMPNHDIIPFGMTKGNPSWLESINLIGMQRAGYQKSDILDVRRFIKDVIDGGKHKATTTYQERLSDIDPSTLTPVTKDIYDFITAESKRGILFPSIHKQTS